MITKLKDSLRGINYRLFFSLFIMGLCPAIYTSLRSYWLGGLPGGDAFSIAGQLGWASLFYEVIDEAIILPLFYFLGKDLNDRAAFANKIRGGLLLSAGVYLVVTIFICAFTRPLLYAMAARPEIIDASVVYIRLESMANVFSVAAKFALVALVTIGKEKLVYLLTFVRTGLIILGDAFFLSSLPFSFNLGVNGVAVVNGVVNAFSLFVVLLLLRREGYRVVSKEKIDFHWTRDFLKIGGISGLESFVRNAYYLVFISRMMNVFGEQGTYWTAGNFIWGWLLLPILQLGEVIKREVATDNTKATKNATGYVALTLFICALWFVFLPGYKPFMRDVLRFTDVDKLYDLTLLLLGFYVLFAVQNVWDAVFYGLGKTHYMLFESICTNVIYYSIWLIFYANGTFIPSLRGVALMFGGGMAFDAVVSLIVFIYYTKKEKKKIGAPPNVE